MAVSDKAYTPMKYVKKPMNANHQNLRVPGVDTVLGGNTRAGMAFAIKPKPIMLAQVRTIKIFAESYGVSKYPIGTVRPTQIQHAIIPRFETQRSLRLCG